jgi:hypothetical protein
MYIYINNMNTYKHTNKHTIISKIGKFLILLFHIFVIIMALIIPFSNSNYLLMMYIITIPVVLMHWIFKDNTCMISLVEKKIRKTYGSNIDDCVTCKLIEPIYDFSKNNEKYSNYIYIITIIIYFVAVFRMFYKYKIGTITKFSDLFKL